MADIKTFYAGTGSAAQTRATGQGTDNSVVQYVDQTVDNMGNVVSTVVHEIIRTEVDGSGNVTNTFFGASREVDVSTDSTTPYGNYDGYSVVHITTREYNDLWSSGTAGTGTFNGDDNTIFYIRA